MYKLNYKRISVFVGVLGLLSMLLIAWGLLLPDYTPAAAQSDSDRTAVNQDLTIQKGEVVKGDVTVTDGNLTMLGEVRSNVIVVNGKAVIEGTVHGDVTVTGGDIELRAASVVEGNVLALGGKVVHANGATVRGTISAPDGISLNGVTNAIVAAESPKSANGASEAASALASTTVGGMVGSLIQLFSKGMISFALLVLGLLLVAVIPTRVSLSSATLEAAPVPSLLVGLIVFFLLFPVAGILAGVLFISIVGWLFLPVLAVGLLAALLFGLVTVSTWVGRAVHESVHPGGHGVTNQLFVYVLLGMSVVLGITLVPSLFMPGSVTALMVMLLYFTSCVGIASGILSRFGTLVPPRHAHHYPVHIHQANNQSTQGMQPGPQPTVGSNPPPPAPPGQPPSIP